VATMPTMGFVALADRVLGGEAVGMKRRRSCSAVHLRASAFAGYRFPPDVILLAVRWYLRFGLSYRDLEDYAAHTNMPRRARWPRSAGVRTVP
jgi:hypothetical protein